MNCNNEILSFENFPHLKEYNEAFEQKIDDIKIYLSHYTFDSNTVMYVRSKTGERLVFWDYKRNFCEDVYFEHDGILKHLEKVQSEIKEKYNEKGLNNSEIPIVIPFLESSVEVNWKLIDDNNYTGTMDSKFFAQISPCQHKGMFLWMIFHQDSGFNQWGGASFIS
jgi:hypothetical protein